MTGSFFSRTNETRAPKFRSFGANSFATCKVISPSSTGAASPKTRLRLSRLDPTRWTSSRIQSAAPAWAPPHRCWVTEFFGGSIPAKNGGDPARDPVGGIVPRAPDVWIASLEAARELDDGVNDDENARP